MLRYFNRQSGFTLVEIMVTMGATLIVFLAASNVLMVFMQSNATLMTLTEVDIEAKAVESVLMHRLGTAQHTVWSEGVETVLYHDLTTAPPFSLARILQTSDSPPVSPVVPFSPAATGSGFWYWGEAYPADWQVQDNALAHCIQWGTNIIGECGVAGSDATHLRYPTTGVEVAGYLYLSDTGNQRLVRTNCSSKPCTLETIMGGNWGRKLMLNESLLAARVPLRTPTYLQRQGDNLYILDSAVGQVYQLQPATGSVRLAGELPNPPEGLLPVSFTLSGDAVTAIDYVTLEDATLSDWQLSLKQFRYDLATNDVTSLAASLVNFPRTYAGAFVSRFPLQDYQMVANSQGISFQYVVVGGDTRSGQKTRSLKYQ